MSEFFGDLSFLQGIDVGLLAIAVLGGAIRVGTPYLFVSLGECITERAGRVNLGLEGTLIMGAMTASSISHDAETLGLGLLAP